MLLIAHRACGEAQATFAQVAGLRNSATDHCPAPPVRGMGGIRAAICSRHAPRPRMFDFSVSEVIGIKVRKRCRAQDVVDQKLSGEPRKINAGFVEIAPCDQ
ncbi:hypothetical protein AB0O34_35685 [Sphaerisporangium sp. NPDC088356]|uniref:hypothetical protein n=1 Tax=Sphaerisporangium sp. NPDC088356 TaxID=3154871 RepID=UPI0034212A44